MATVTFDRDRMASWYAMRHFKTDPGIKHIYYLRTNAPDREIRFLEINDMIVQRDDDPIEPIDFGVDTGNEDAHTLMVLDVTPDQWEKISNQEIRLPMNWDLSDAIEFHASTHE